MRAFKGAKDNSMRLCAITDRKSLASAGEEEPLSQKLRRIVLGWVEGGVDFIQLREKDLGVYRVARLAEEIWAGAERRHSNLLINLPASAEWLLALAPVADGAHIPGPPKAGTAEVVRRGVP